MVMLAICMIMMLGMCAMVVDLGRFFIIVRQLQNAADSSSLSGAQALAKLDPMDPQSVPLSNVTTGGWLQVKPRVRFILSNFSIRSLETVSTGFSYNLGTMGAPDPSPFEGTQGLTSASNSGRIRVNVERGIVCYNPGSGEQFFRSLENERSLYCLANTVQVTLTTYDIPVYFAKIFGMTSKGALTRTSRSNVRRAYPNSCGDPSCGIYFQDGIYDNSEPDGGPLNPLLSCPPFP